MSNLPTLRQLRYLVALTETRHFGRAAEGCFATQSTLSAGLQELEGLLGVRLVERTKRRVVPTAVGLEIAARARRVLAEAEELVETARQSAEPLSGALRIGVIPTIGPYLIPRLLPVLRERFPRLKAYLREDQSARVMAQLTAGDLDVVILAFPYDTPGADTHVVTDDPFWLVCPETHPLARKTEVTAADIPLAELLLLEDGHCLRDHVLAACGLRAQGAGTRFQGTSLYTLVGMAAGGLGVTLAPEMAVRTALLDGLPLVARPLIGDSAHRRIGLAWRRTSGRGKEFRRLGDTLHEVMTTR